jgi:hypothetical protein
VGHVVGAGCGHEYGLKRTPLDQFTEHRPPVLQARTRKVMSTFPAGRGSPRHGVETFAVVVVGPTVRHGAV